MDNDAKEIISSRAKLVDSYIKSFLINYESQTPGLGRLYESMKYSLSNGGKRFRPVLSILTAELLGYPAEKVLAYGAAVEFIHTYSLIHDDLPCMDDDDERRGQPTNHVKFDETTALLAGDALQTEAFYLISSNYMAHPESALKACLELSRAAGPRGMVGGQAIDLASVKLKADRELLTKIHEMKTGALIRSAVVGAAYLAQATEQEINDLKDFGESLGMAFQVADDILDHGEDDSASFTSLLGLDGATAYLEELSKECLDLLSGFGSSADELKVIVEYNRTRKK